ncbi:MAG: beta-L-arabinofuranosidase domain-containing protein [Chitinophagales bacterium]
MNHTLSTTIGFTLTILLLSFQSSFSQHMMSDPFQKIKPVPEQFQQLPLNAIKPTGWLQTQLRENLDGFTGHLDELARELLVTDDIYGANRLTKHVKSKDVGAVAEGGDWQVQFLWWNSETQGNWWDGYIRTAILLNDSVAIQKVQNYINKILSTQDEDGYLGIYDKELRYHFDNENGELWSKTTLLRGFLGWYEYTNDPKILNAIQRAVDNVIANYPVNQSHPFHSVNPNAGGLTHGLAFTDVLEKLYQLTGNQQYLDYCLFLYKDFSQQILNEDAQYKKLIDSALALQGHGVHTSEHLRSVAAAYYASGNPDLKIALDNFLKKIAACITPSGAPLGDEYIGGRKADALTGYEYCSLHELLQAYTSLLAKTGDAAYGDKTEQLFFNAAQGARYPTGNSICYLKTDNTYYLTGGMNGDTSNKKQTRYRYSPVHKEAAVCCVPNAGRIGPAYIQSMWMKNGNNLIATLPGPCEVTTQLNGQEVFIQEITNYPFDNTITFKIKTKQPIRFTIKVRKPLWAVKISCSSAHQIKDDYIVLSKKWKDGDSFTIRFDAAVMTKQESNGEYYFTYGALVLAHPIASTEKIMKQFPVAGLKEFTCTPDQLTIYQYTGNNTIQSTKSDVLPGELSFRATLFNPALGIQEEINLVPMSKTILRQVTFKQK